jgi:four helix bundle suffix protein
MAVAAGTHRTPDANYDTFRKAIENPEPEIRANAMIGLNKITSYLLNNQIKALEAAFLNEGGLRERMTAARINKRNKDRYNS